MSIGLLFALLISFVHPIHISVSEVEIATDEITWISRIYKDDLLIGIYGKNATLDMLDDPDQIKADIYKYLKKEIALHVNGRPLEWSLQEIQPDPEAIWITMSSPVEGKSISSFMVKNEILFDVYKDQKNIVNISGPSCKKNIVFERGDAPKQITLD